MKFFNELVTGKYKPKVFMSDYDNFYPKAIRGVIPGCSFANYFTQQKSN
jgi:hypothetical protein